MPANGCYAASGYAKEPLWEKQKLLTTLRCISDPCASAASNLSSSALHQPKTALQVGISAQLNICVKSKTECYPSTPALCCLSVPVRLQLNYSVSQHIGFPAQQTAQQLSLFISEIQLVAGLHVTLSHP